MLPRRKNDNPPNVAVCEHLTAWLEEHACIQLQEIDGEMILCVALKCENCRMHQSTEEFRVEHRDALDGGGRNPKR